MFNWILDVLAARSPAATKRSVDRYTRRAAIAAARKSYRDATPVKSVSAPTVLKVRTPRTVKPAPLKSVA